VPRKSAPLLLLLFVALGVGWLLFRPIPHSGRVVRHLPTDVIPPITRYTGTPAARQPAASAAPTVSASPTLSASPAPRTPAPAEHARVALIIDDCGQWPTIERGFLALPIALTLSVLPHVRYTATIAQEAHAAGKGVMLHLPMETLSGLDPGPGTIATSMDDDQVAAQVEDDLDQVPLASGVNNHEGSKASADARVMRVVMQVLSRHHDLFFIDSRTSAASVAANVAGESGIRAASRAVFLDNRADLAYTESQLREAAAIATRSGSAIAIGHPRETTLAAVRALIPEFRAQGIAFVLAGSLAR